MTVRVIFTEIDARQTLFRHSGISTRNILPALKKNDVYRATSGQLIPGAGKLSFRELAKAVGYHHVYEFDKLEDLESSIETTRMRRDLHRLSKSTTAYRDVSLPVSSASQGRIQIQGHQILSRLARENARRVVEAVLFDSECTT